LGVIFQPGGTELLRCKECRPGAFNQWAVAKIIGRYRANGIKVVYYSHYGSSAGLPPEVVVGINFDGGRVISGLPEHEYEIGPAGDEVHCRRRPLPLVV
jgi:hypothetical protein